MTTVPMDKDLALLKHCLETRNPILLTGAGFSCGATGKNGKRLPLGGRLCADLFTEVILPNKAILDPEDFLDAEYCSNRKKLKDLCSIIRRYEKEGLIARRNELFESIFSKCTYNDAEYYQYLTDYEWSYIFTLNIDGLIEQIYNDQGRPLTKWLLSPCIYSETPSVTTLVKLHGDISKAETFVFDDKEYEAFTFSNSWMLQKFASLYINHDVIILGTQFQEVDINRMLSGVFDHGCDNSNFFYFFVSPGDFNRELQQEINSRKNFVHIRMNVDEFLTFIHKEVKQPTEAIQKLTAKGIVYWNDELERAGRETWELYHGNQPDPSDFKHSVDIPRKREMSEILEFIEGNNFGIIEVKGSPYVGKSCLSLRILTEEYAKHFKTFYFPFVDTKLLFSFKDYINSLNPDNSTNHCGCSWLYWF